MNAPTKLTVAGMTCGHCKASVEEALKGVPGVKGVHVDLERGVALVGGDDDVGALVAAVEDEGYAAAPAG